jgi:5-bromo-4-chloroindolyl phosphate hydrolysis protein
MNNIFIKVLESNYGNNLFLYEHLEKLINLSEKSGFREFGGTDQ